MVNTGSVNLGLGFFSQAHKNHFGSPCSSFLIRRDWERRSHFRRVNYFRRRTVWFCREVFGFAVRFWFWRELFGFAVRYLVLP